MLAMSLVAYFAMSLIAIVAAPMPGYFSLRNTLW